MEAGFVADGAGGAEERKPDAGGLGAQGEAEAFDAREEFGEERGVGAADELGAEDFDARRIQLREDAVEFGAEEAGVVAGGVGFEAKGDAGFVVEAAGGLGGEAVEGGEGVAEGDEGVDLVENGKRGGLGGPRPGVPTW